MDLLDMLHHLCSRPDYVCYYRPHSELNKIMVENDVRVSDPVQELSCPTEFYAATKAFGALLKACQTDTLMFSILRKGTARHYALSILSAIIRSL